MRKTLIALLLAASLPTIAMAMPGDGSGMDGRGMDGFGPPHGEHHGPFGSLNLTPDQRQQVGQIMGEQMNQRREIARKYLEKLPAAEQKAMRDEMDASQKKAQADVRALLTPDQQKQFDAEAQKREQRRAEFAEFQAWKAAKDKKAQ